MSWRVSVPAGRLEGFRDRALEAEKANPVRNQQSGAPEEAALQLEVAVNQAEQMVRGGALGEQNSVVFTASLSGHANADHAAGESLTVYVSQSSQSV